MPPSAPKSLGLLCIFAAVVGLTLVTQWQPDPRQLQTAVVRTEPTPSPSPPQPVPVAWPLVFVKFFKVGGTTAAELIGRLAQRDGARICCRPHDACDACYTHNTLAMWRTGGRAAFAADAMVITLLRDPVERELSRYFYDRARGESRAQRQTLAQWAHTVPNDYAAVLGGGDAERACAALSADFALVGITERSLEFFAHLGITLGQRPADMAYESLKRVVDRPAAADVSPAAIATLANRLVADVRVYQCAARLFAERPPPPGLAAYVAQLNASLPAAACTFDEHRGAPGLSGKDCLRVRPARL